jgi:hypothetical protein
LNRRFGLAHWGCREWHLQHIGSISMGTNFGAVIKKPLLWATKSYGAALQSLQCQGSRSFSLEVFYFNSNAQPSTDMSSACTMSPAMAGASVR